MRNKRWRALCACVIALLAAVRVQALELPAEWVKREAAVFVGQYGIASDPALLALDDGYLMVYTCIDPLQTPVRTLICAARSDDGLAWQNIETDDVIDGAILRGRVGEWDERLESPYLVQRDDALWLYYSGYRDEGDPAPGFPAALGLARSTDGVTFERVSDAPIMQPTAGGPDNDAIYSAVIASEADGYRMIYVGHCYTNCDDGAGVRLLGATSADGVTWDKQDAPVLVGDASIAWTTDGVAEPALTCADDGCALFFTGLQGEARVIGVATADSAAGPWTIQPDPIITPTPDGLDAGGALAPFVLYSDGVWRMWYLAADADGLLSVGYAEAGAAG
jgi:predicted GH43/DUF377 family glycosyl hydrolase